MTDIGYTIEHSSDLGDRPPKVCLVGDSGAGKTHTCLAMPGKKLIIDGENGLRPFSDRFDFDRVNTENPYKVYAILQDILKDPKGYTMLAIDPISTIWHEMVDSTESYELHRKAAKERRKVDQLEDVLTYASWRKIKQLNRKIISAIRRLDMPVIVTARAKALGSNPHPTEFQGMAPESEKNLLYEFDIVIWMRRWSTGERSFFVWKDRYKRLPEEFKEPVHKVLLDTFPNQWGRSDVLARPVATEGQIEEFDSLVSAAGWSDKQVAMAISKHGVDRFEELAPEKAESILEVVRIRVGGMPQEVTSNG